MESITYPSCVFCGSLKNQPLYDTESTAGDRFILNKCQSCNCRFIFPKPTKQQMDAAYDESYFGQGDNKFSGWIEKVIDHFRLQRAKTLMRYVKSPANVLDIGCGNGNFLKNLIDKHYNGYGVELPSKAAERALRVLGPNLRIGQLYEADFKAHFF